MKKLFLATTAFVVLAAASAGAADMTARPAYAAPPPVYTWTGVYWGANVGYGWGNARTNINSNATELGVAESTQISQSQKIDGVIGGVQAGYNYQFGTWVWGWETDFQGSGQKGGSTFNTTLVAPVPIPLTATTDHKLEWFGTARGRLGFLWGPRTCCSMVRQTSPTARSRTARRSTAAFWAVRSQHRLFTTSTT